MKNEKLVELNIRLVSVQSLIGLTDMKITTMLEAMKKAESGRDDYEHNRGSVVFSFLSMHRAKYKEAKKRYEAALSERKKIEKTLEGICKDIRRYAFNCIPPEYRKMATVEYKPFNNFISISYFVDGDVGNEFVRLRLYINDNEG